MDFWRKDVGEESVETYEKIEGSQGAVKEWEQIIVDSAAQATVRLSLFQ